MSVGSDPSSSNELAGRVIGITAERRADQQVRFLERRGAATRVAPVLKTVDGAERPKLVEVARSIVDDPPEVFIVQTGQGLRWWLEVLDDDLGATVIERLAVTEVWCRGSKAASACRNAGLQVTWQAPNESVADIAAHIGAVRWNGRSVVVQLDGSDGRELLRLAEKQGAAATGLDVYRYRLPDDRGPVLGLIEEVIDGTVDAVTFTASPQIRHLRQIAAETGRGPALDLAFSDRCLATVVGPMCAATAADAGWTNIIEPPTARLMPMLTTLRDALATR